MSVNRLSFFTACIVGSVFTGIWLISMNFPVFAAWIFACIMIAGAIFLEMFDSDAAISFLKTIIFLVGLVAEGFVVGILMSAILGVWFLAMAVNGKLGD